MALARLLMLLLTAGCSAQAQQPIARLKSSPVADRYGWTSPTIVIRGRVVPSGDA